VGSKRGSRDLKAGEGSRMVRFLGTAWRVESVCGACFEERCCSALNALNCRDAAGSRSCVDSGVLASVSRLRFRFPGPGGGAKDSCAFTRAPKLMSMREEDFSSPVTETSDYIL
jgi:hypothetical protein